MGGEASLGGYGPSWPAPPPPPVPTALLKRNQKTLKEFTPEHSTMHDRARKRWKKPVAVRVWDGVHRRSQEGPGDPPNSNATNDKNVTKSLLFLRFQFLLASSRTTVHAYNSN